jgi:XTP/dITP diphosphohydrolase
MPRNSARVVRRRLVVATGNPGKLREFRALLREFPFDAVSQGDLGQRTPEETGASFLDNALLKARFAARASGFAALADDSGLEVDALGGAPGVHSARYFATVPGGAARAVAGDPIAVDRANNETLLHALRGCPPERREARYRCVLVMLEGPDDPDPLIAEGVWPGVILEAARGRGGFGYDPLFFVPQLGMSAAELDPADKNRLSHRGQAMAALGALLRTRLARESAALPPSPPPRSAADR